MMKNIVSLIFLVLPAIGLAQTGNYIISGRIGHYNAPAKAYLVYNTGDKSITDSAILKDGAFTFKGTVSEPVRASLIVNRKGNGIHRPFDRVLLYVDQGTTIVNSADSAAQATVTGTRANEDNARLHALLKAVDSQRRAADAMQQAATAETRATETFKQKMELLNDGLDKQTNLICKKFIEGNPSSVVSLSTLHGLSYTEDFKELNILFHHLTPALQQSVAGKQFALQLDQLKLIAIGHPAPEFAQPDTNGTLVKLSSFRGKYVLVDFWASWCEPCRAESPNVLRAYRQYQSKNFTVLSVSLDGLKDKALWLKAIHADGLPWTQVSDLKSWQNEAAQLYQVRAIPTNFLIGPDGTIVAKNLMGSNLTNKLKDLMIP